MLCLADQTQGTPLFTVFCQKTHPWKKITSHLNSPECHSFIMHSVVTEDSFSASNVIYMNMGLSHQHTRNLGLDACSSVCVKEARKEELECKEDREEQEEEECKKEEDLVLKPVRERGWCWMIS